MSKIWFASFALAMTPFAAAAQDSAAANAHSTPPTVEMVREYLSIGGGDELLFDSAFYGSQVAAEHRRLQTTPEQWERIDALLRTSLRDATQVLLDDLTVYYGRHSTAEDLQAALAFYRTDAGRRYIHTYLALSTRYSTQLQLQISPPLAPDLTALDPARLERARSICAVLMARVPGPELQRWESVGFNAEFFGELMARKLAQSLSASELEAAFQWVSSAEAERLEGGDAERRQAVRAAMAHAMGSVDADALRQQILTILSEGPT